MWNKGYYLLLAVFLAVISGPVIAEEGIKTSSEMEMQISSLPEAKLSFSQSFSFPFLQSQNPLMADNNLKLVLGAYVTPVSLSGMSEVFWTPAAFFLLSGGARAASGWNMPLGKGIGINEPLGVKVVGVPRQAVIEADAFDGLVWSAWGAGTVQFDLAAVIPGDWNHVVFQTRHEFRYSAYSRAGSNDSWVFENDDGENRNGWEYFATYILGYQMPVSPVFKMIGIMAELEKNLYFAPDGDYWGDSLGYWIFSALSVFAITPRFNTTLAIQIRTRRNDGSSDFKNNNDYYYQDRRLLSEGGERRVVFYRLAMMLNYRLR